MVSLGGNTVDHASTDPESIRLLPGRYLIALSPCPCLPSRCVLKISKGASILSDDGKGVINYTPCPIEGAEIYSDKNLSAAARRPPFPVPPEHDPAS
jgi:hypothetical protein